MPKPNTTKTLGALHFEELEPHRFESLVRNLIYDFRNWQVIEPTGQGGNDSGFDIRAWEKVDEIRNADENDDENGEGTHPMEGNLWMIQCKREKEFGPSKIKSIINSNINSKNSPYGYILTAPVNFSKTSHDIFREELRSKGVMEFYLWGKNVLEDMLFLPKNDRVLFAFFGISLNTKKRLKTSEIKFLLNNKNKLFRLLGGQDQNSLRESILLRDFKDENYPFEGEYDDFQKNPRWKEYVAYSYHPLGIWVHIKECYAYIDQRKKVFDFIKSVDLLFRQGDARLNREDDRTQKEQVLDYWERLPMNNQATLGIDGLILYEDMLVIDGMGDVIHPYPHIFVDFSKKNSPFKGHRYLLEINKQQVVDVNEEDYKKTNFFPKKIPKIRLGKIYKDTFVNWDEETVRFFRNQFLSAGRIYDLDGKYDFLKIGDVIAVKMPTNVGDSNGTDRFYLNVTYKFNTTVDLFLKDYGDFLKREIERQVGREVKLKEKLNILEVRNIYDWKFEGKKSRIY